MQQRMTSPAGSLRLTSDGSDDAGVGRHAATDGDKLLERKIQKKLERKDH